MESLAFTALPSLNKTLVLELARCEYVARRENVIALGNSGPGKTHIALGLRLAACQKSLPVGFTPPRPWLTNCTKLAMKSACCVMQPRLAGYKLLIVDELGYVPLSPTGAISAPRQELLHAGVADAIERVYRGAANERAGDIADHLLKVGSFTDDRKLVRWLTLAGKSALDAAAFEEARRNFLSALSHQGAVEPGQRAGLALVIEGLVMQTYTQIGMPRHIEMTPALLARPAGR